MPYIPKEERKKYDDAIDDLDLKLNGLTNDELSGHLNYVLFRLAGLLSTKLPKSATVQPRNDLTPAEWAAWIRQDDKDKIDKREQHNYARMAVIRSAMIEAHDEFHRRVMAPYEDEKIKSAGDVEL